MSELPVDQVVCGDAIGLMQKLPSNSIHAIVTDPPYGLEFMGEEWDKFGGDLTKQASAKFVSIGRGTQMEGCGFDKKAKPSFYNISKQEMLNYQQWTTAWAREALRVLKPGASMLVMGGTRTYHRMACGVEDAGFEIKDTVLWCYNCLSEDTESFINGKWEYCNRAKKGDIVLCYNLKDKKLEFGRIFGVFIYDYEGELIRLYSDKTDQLVTPNHNCVIWSEGEPVFQRADSLEQKISLPVLEEVQNLWRAVSNIQLHASKEKQDLLKGMCQQSHLVSTTEASSIRTAEDGEANLSCLQKRVLEAKSLDEQDELLFKAVQRKNQDTKSPPEVEGNGIQNLDERTQRNSTPEDVGRKELGLEGRGDLLQNPRQLWGSKIHPLPEGVYRDGSKGRLCDGASAFGGETDWSLAQEVGGGTSYRPRPDQQRLRQFGVVGEQSTAQEIGERRPKIKTTLATKSTVKYKGKVWCIKVSTGAFVARRNGQIFITGNSGFPKAQDASKMIDRKLGAERKVIGKAKWSQPAKSGHHAGLTAKHIKKTEGRFTPGITTPATDLAKRWDGWKVGGLKPSYEPIIWAVKPPEGSYVDNVLKHGVGAVNVDACRIPRSRDDRFEYGVDGDEPSTPGKTCYGEWGRHIYEPDSQGRYPANMIRTDRFRDGYDRFYFVPKASRAERDEGLGEMPERKMPHSTSMTCAKCGLPILSGTTETCKCTVKSEVRQKARNIHPTVKPVHLMEHLIKLVTREGQIVLDPFVGSGTTCIAARKLNRHYIGFDNNPEYIEIAKRRLVTIPPPLEIYSESLEG